MSSQARLAKGTRLGCLSFLDEFNVIDYLVNAHASIHQEQVFDDLSH
jgi:hypothetical protein